MLYSLIFVAVALFTAHVALLFASFRRSGFSRRNYFYSHLTLWLTGVTVFWLAWQYHGQGLSGFLDYFNSFGRLAVILVFTAALSLTAHLIVKFLVLPVWHKH